MAPFFAGQLMAWDLQGSALVSGKPERPPHRRRRTLRCRFRADTGHDRAALPGSACGSWTAGTGRETGARSKTRRTVWSQAWSPDSRWFLTVGPRVLTLWNPDTGRRIGERTYGQRGRRGGHLRAQTGTGSTSMIATGTSETLDRATLRPVGTTPNQSRGRDRHGAGIRRTARSSEPGHDGSIIRVDPEAGRVLATESVGLGPQSTTPASTWVELGLPGRIAARRSSSAGRSATARHRHLGVGSQRGLHRSRPRATSPSPRTEASSPLGMASGVRIWDGRTGAYRAGIPLRGCYRRRHGVVPP